MDRELQRELFGSDSEEGAGAEANRAAEEAEFDAALDTEMQARVLNAIRLLKGVWDATVRVETVMKSQVAKAQAEVDEVAALQQELPNRMEQVQRESHAARMAEIDAKRAYDLARIRAQKAQEAVDRANADKVAWQRAAVDKQREADKQSNELLEHQTIVRNAHRMYSNYVADANKWERDGFVNESPDGKYEKKRVYVAESKGQGRFRELPTPWVAPPREPTPPASPDEESAEESEDPFGDNDTDTDNEGGWGGWGPPPLPPPPPAKRPKPRVVNDEDSSDDDVVMVGQRSWKERDDEARRNAVDLTSPRATSSCVEAAFRKIGL